MRHTHEPGILYTSPQRREVGRLGVGSEKAQRGRLVHTNVVLDESLRTLVRLREQEGIWDLRGRVEWEGDLQEMSKGRVFDGDR